MTIKRIIKLKENIREVRARELREVDNNINAIMSEISRLEEEEQEVNLRAKSDFSEALLYRYRALLSQKAELFSKLKELQELREHKKERLKEVYKDLKALNLVKERLDREERARSTTLEQQNQGFNYLMKRFRNA